jgi:hypothetical protein
LGTNPYSNIQNPYSHRDPYVQSLPLSSRGSDLRTTPTYGIVTREIDDEVREVGIVAADADVGVVSDSGRWRRG